MSDSDSDNAPYNQPLQIGGVFIVMAASAMGILLPYVIYKCGMQHSPAVQLSLLFMKLIGVGVVISTGFIHMLGDAADSFSRDENPDLPPIFDYDAWVYVFAIFTMFCMGIFDFVAMRNRYAKKGLVASEIPEVVDGSTFGSMEGCHDHSLELVEPKTSNNKGSDCCDDEECATGVKAHFTQAQSRVMSLEAGILIHSVLIGLDLGMQRGTTFVTLLTAIVFHQFFEGFALSQVVIEAKFKGVGPLIFATIFYALTTPVGIAAGIGVHSTFDEGSVPALITIGVLDSISGGILIYIGVLTLMGTWLINNHQLAKAHWIAPVLAFFGLAIGLAIMAIIGIWA